jgi:hypothetical protein
MASILKAGGAANLTIAFSQEQLQDGHRLCHFDLPRANFSLHEAEG